MYCTSFAGDISGRHHTSMWIWSGDTAPRTITASLACQICRSRSRARSATRPPQYLVSILRDPHEVILDVENRVRARAIFEHPSILAAGGWKLIA
jgi:hypothetical protein